MSDITTTPAVVVTSVTPVDFSEKFATAAEVKVWARENGFESIADEKTRGRLPLPAIKAFNAAHKSRKYVGAQDRAVKVSGLRETVGKDGKTRKVPFAKTVTVSEAREIATAAGLASMTRGRMSREAYAHVIATLTA